MGNAGVVGGWWLSEPSTTRESLVCPRIAGQVAYGRGQLGEHDLHELRRFIEVDNHEAETTSWDVDSFFLGFGFLFAKEGPQHF